MRNRRLARAVLLLAVALAPGCQAMHAYRPIAIRVQDAETNQPIADAVVHLSYPLAPAAEAPSESSGATPPDGVVRLQAAPYGPAGVLVEVKAKGYLLEQKTLPIETVQAIKPAGWFEKVGQRPVDLAIALYADPRPVVELVLPAGFRGMIKAEVQVEPDMRNTPGNRLFRYSVSPAGTVQVIGPPLVERVAPLDYQAVTADGTRLTRSVQGLDVGFYAVKSDGHALTFFVGTRAEYDAIRIADRLSDGRPDGTKSGGGRRGGRRNQPPPDPTVNNGGS